MTEHVEDLKEIRRLMEQSSKFLSLSGLSGIAVGLVALLASMVIYFYESIFGFSRLEYQGRFEFILGLVLSITLLLALSLAIYFTSNKARKRGELIWSPIGKKVLVSMSIPLVVGALVIVNSYNSGWVQPLSGFTLIFYGLALINASHYTFKDVYYLGFLELIIGLAAIYWTSYSLLFWALGFGVLHIFYGARVYFKYEK